VGFAVSWLESRENLSPRTLKRDRLPQRELAKANRHCKTSRPSVADTRHDPRNREGDQGAIQEKAAALGAQVQVEDDDF
jgi:hypothetical protein